MEADDSTLSINSRILQWMESISTSSSINQSSSLTSSANSINIETNLKYICSENVNLEQILNNSLKGRTVQAEFRKNGLLSAKNQKDLVHCIADYFIFNKRKMSYKEMDIISSKIVELFPTEKKVFIY